MNTAVEPAKGPLAISRLETKTSHHLKVRSRAFAEGDAIPREFSAYDDGMSFPLAWSEGPAGTQSYAVLVEDPDVRRAGTPYVHWTLWNIPAHATHLPRGLSARARLDEPAGARQGATSAGDVGYFGPRPPVGDPAHHYHVQVFALDGVLALPAGSDREELVEALGGHVLASGELVGTFERAAP